MIVQKKSLAILIIMIFALNIFSVAPIQETNENSPVSTDTDNLLNTPGTDHNNIRNNKTSSTKTSTVNSVQESSNIEYTEADDSIYEYQERETVKVQQTFPLSFDNSYTMNDTDDYNDVAVSEDNTNRQFEDSVNDTHVYDNSNNLLQNVVIPSNTTYLNNTASGSVTDTYTHDHEYLIYESESISSCSGCTVGSTNSYLMEIEVSETSKTQGGTIEIKDYWYYDTNGSTHNFYKSFYNTSILEFNATHVNSSSYIKFRPQTQWIGEDAVIGPDGARLEFKYSIYNYDTDTWHDYSTNFISLDPFGDLYGQDPFDDHFEYKVDVVKVFENGFGLDNINIVSDDRDHVYTQLLDYYQTDYRVNLLSIVDNVEMIYGTNIHFYNSTMSPGATSSTFVSGELYKYTFSTSDNQRYVDMRIKLINDYQWFRNSSANSVGETLLILQLKDLNTGEYTNISSTSHSNSGYSSLPLLENFTITIDQLISKRPDVTFQQRLFTKYNTATQGVAKLSITSDQLGTNNTIQVPLYLNFSHINPYSITKENLTVVNFVSSFVGQYELFFLFGAGWGRDYARQRQLLAISSVTSDYMQSPSFESGSNDDFTGSGFDDEATNTSIVSMGSFAYRVESTSSGTDTLTFNELNPGEYYFSFDYYIESSSYSSLNLQYHDGSTWQSIELDSTTTDRWHTQTEFIHVQNSDYANNLRFSFDSGSGVIFIDNHRLSQSNAQVENYEYNHFKFNYQVVSLDNRKNPSVSNIYTNVTLGDRTAQTDIKTKSCYTDSNGMCSVDWKASFEPKEYYLTVQTETNSTTTYFTPLPSSAHSYSYETSGLKNDLKNHIDFSEGTDEGGVYQNSEYHSVQDGYLSIVDNVATDNVTRIYWDNADYSTNDLPYLAVRVRVNVTDDITFSIRRNSWSGFQVGSKSLVSFVSDNWQFLLFELDSGETISELAIVTSNHDRYVKFDYDYVYPVDTWGQGFAWEFEEPGYEDGWVDHNTPAKSTVIDGYYSVEANSAYDGVSIQLEETHTTTDYKFQLKLRAESTIDDWQFEFYEGGLFKGHGNLDDFTITTDWQVITIDSTLITSTTTFDKIIIDSYSGGTLNTELYIGYVRLIDHTQYPDLEVDSSTGLTYFDNQDNQTDIYKTWINGSSYGIYSEYELFYLPMQSSNTYSFTYATIASDDPRKNHVQIASTIYEYPYIITSSDLTTITILDQRGDYIPSQQFRIYVDETRIRGDTFLWSDTSSTKNLTITDFWGQILYQDTAENFDRFIDLEMTLYSTKIYNIQTNPVYVSITNGPTFSEWILPGEVIEYRLRPDQYNFTIQYSTDASGVAAATLNGTTAEYIYTVAADNAIVVSGFTIQDVYSNVLSLQQDLSDTNSSIHTSLNLLQSNITIQIDSVNGDLTLIANDIEILDSNLASNFTTIISDLVLIDEGIASNFTQIFTEFLAIDGNLASNFTLLFADILEIDGNLASNFTQIYSNLAVIEADIASINVTSNVTQIYSQLIQLDTQMASNFTATLLQIDLTNATQVELIINTYNLLLETGQVHFDLVNLAGVGIPFESVKILINDSRIYSPDQWYKTGTFLNITVMTFYNQTIRQFNETITARFNQTQDVTITIPLYLQHFTNQDYIPISVYLEFDNVNLDYNQSLVLNKNESIAMWVILGTYDITVYPLVTSITNGTHRLNFTTSTYNNIDLPTASKRVSFSTDLTAAKIEPAGKLGEVNLFGIDIIITVAIVATIIIMAITYLFAQIGLALLKGTGLSVFNLLLYPFNKEIRSKIDFYLANRGQTHSEKYTTTSGFVKYPDLTPQERFQQRERRK